MKKISKVSLAAALALGAVASVPSFAAEASPCTSVVYHQDFIKAYPYAPAACQAVVDKGGVKKIHFIARVSEVNKDSVKVVFLNVAGNPIDTHTGRKDLTFTAAPNANLSVNGKKIKVGELKKGDKLDFWIPENRVGLYTDAEADMLSTISLN